MKNGSGEYAVIPCFYWRAMRELNPRPLVPETNALSNWANRPGSNPIYHKLIKTANFPEGLLFTYLIIQSLKHQVWSNRFPLIRGVFEVQNIIILRIVRSLTKNVPFLPCNRILIHWWSIPNSHSAAQLSSPHPFYLSSYKLVLSRNWPFFGVNGLHLLYHIS